LKLLPERKDFSLDKPMSGQIKGVGSGGGGEDSARKRRGSSTKQ